MTYFLKMDDPWIFILISIAFTVSIVYSVFFNKEKLIIRKLKKINSRSISQLQSNELAKVSGKALHVKEPLIAPFSKRKCVAHIIKIEQQKSSGKSNYWKELVNQEHFQEFFLEKGGDVLIVKPRKVPKNYITHLVEDRTISSGFLNDPSPEFQKVLRYYGIDSETLLGFNKTLRYSERIIEVGEYITVAGKVKWKEIDPDVFPEYRYSRIAALESDENQKLIITDMIEASDKRTTSSSVL